MKPLPLESPTVEGRGPRNRLLDLVLVSSDDGLLIELGAVVGNRFRTHPVDRVDAAAAAVSGPAWMAIIDAGSQEDARAAVARLEQQHRGVPLIVLAATDDVSAWIGALSRGVIIDVIPRREITGPRLGTALTAAETRLRAVPAASAQPAKAAPAAIRSLRFFLLGAIALVVVAATGWWLVRRPGAQVPAASVPAITTGPSAAAATAAASSKPQTVLELLSAARVAFADQKQLLPRSDGEAHGDSALELYAQALAQEPSNDEAIDGMRRLWSVARPRIQSDVAGGKLDDAARLLTAFKSSGVDAEAVRELDTSLASARSRFQALTRVQESIAANDVAGAEQQLSQLGALGVDRNTVQELRRNLDARRADAQVTTLAAAVKAALDSGALLDPANDNARTRLAALRAVSRTGAQTLAAQHDVQAALLARAQDATRRQQFDQAQRFLGAAGDIAATTEVADAKKALQAEMDAAAQRAAVAAAAAVPADKPKAATDSAAPKAVASYFPARATQPLHVDFPTAAAEKHQQGYVIVEFTLQPNGRATDATVIDSSPPKVFDRSALDAVSRGHYETQALNDHPTHRARIKLNFQPS
jgi:TonB family protein